MTLADELKEHSNVAESFRAGRIEFHSTLWKIVQLFKAILAVSMDSRTSSALPVPVLAVLFIGVPWDITFTLNNSWTLAAAIALGFHVLATATSQDLAGASDYRAGRAHLA